MDTTQYRIWQPKYKELITLSFAGLQYFDFEGSYALSFVVDGYDGFWAHEQYDTATEEAKEFPIMKSIGLQDRNQKLIFEGDIVRLETDSAARYLRKGHLGVVVFNKANHRYGFCFLNEYNKGGDECRMYFTPIKAKAVSIVGNIYQTPELLK